ncbi:CdaR family protein [uncultured Winogradskyella sp.]|uniref:CdaR family protein n=1 Tax=uncultured Winogradskyella sp. TaxID=395353 RepID=UPI0030DBBF31|tara:strand:+ start:3777 stop:4739 length:963 start_codon:yes stop_codon:yes gene_type:complete
MNSNKKLNILDYLKTKNVKRFSLFFAIASVFLIFSKLSNDYKQTIKLKVNLVNLEDEIILQNDSLNTINAYIEAKGFSLLPFIFKKHKDIVIDVKTDVASKPNQFIFDVQRYQFLIEGQLGKSYKILSIKPDTLVMFYSKRASKLVPVILNSNINYAIGYDIKEDFRFDLDSVKIVGSSAEVDNINSLSTELLELNDVNTNINEMVKLNISEYNAIEIFPKSINVKADVTRFTEGTIEIPITVRNMPNNIKINYFPKFVTLSYYVDLDNFNAIKASDFVVECNYGDRDEDQAYLVPKIVKKPEFVKRISIKQKRIDFIKL